METVLLNGSSAIGLSQPDEPQKSMVGHPIGFKCFEAAATALLLGCGVIPHHQPGRPTLTATSTTSPTLPEKCRCTPPFPTASASATERPHHGEVLEVTGC